MKSSQLALAMAALGPFCLTGLAQAQSNITVYGVIDLDIVHENNGTTSVTREDTGILNGNRLGFKGSEALANGVAAIFTIEAGFNADTGTQADATRLFGRQSFVGFTTPYGTVKLGRQINPVYATLTSFDPFAIGMAGDSSRLFSYNGSRSDNLATYAWASGGLRAELQYGFGEVAGNAAANRIEAGFAGYRGHGFDLVSTYQNIRNAADTAATRMNLVGGNYEIGPLRVFLTYAVEKGVILGTLTRLDQRDALAGLAWKTSAAGTLMASYIHKIDKLSDNADARQYALGYKHALSARTSLYASYGELHNEDLAKYKVVTAGKTDKLLNAGIRHSF